MLLRFQKQTEALLTFMLKGEFLHLAQALCKVAEVAVCRMSAWTIGLTILLIRRLLFFLQSSAMI